MLMVLLMDACCFVIGTVRLRALLSSCVCESDFNFRRRYSRFDSIVVFVTVVNLKISHALMTHIETTASFQVTT